MSSEPRKKGFSRFLSGKFLLIFFAVAFMLILPIATLASEKKTESETENRTLQVLPEFNFKTYLDASFMQDFEKWFSDHFMLRDSWVALKSDLEYAFGKRENNGVYITPDRLIQSLQEPNEELTLQNIESIRKFAQNFGGETYLVLVPTAAEIYRDTIAYNPNVWDQKGYISGVYDALRDDLHTVDLYEALSSHRDDYIFYRTDHHWTSYGAFLAYSEILKAMGEEEPSLSDYDITHVSEDFNGTLFSKSAYRRMQPDTIDRYDRKNGVKVKNLTVNKITEQQKYKSIYFDKFLGKKDKYSYFLGTNEGHLIIKTDNGNGKNLLVFKDSYAHSVIPFLTEQYSRIDVIDLRYVNVGYKTLVEGIEYDDALILYNMGTFPNDRNIFKIAK